MDEALKNSFWDTLYADDYATSLREILKLRTPDEIGTLMQLVGSESGEPPILIALQCPGTSHHLVHALLEFNADIETAFQFIVKDEKQNGSSDRRRDQLFRYLVALGGHKPEIPADKFAHMVEYLNKHPYNRRPFVIRPAKSGASSRDSESRRRSYMLPATSDPHIAIRARLRPTIPSLAR